MTTLEFYREIHIKYIETLNDNTNFIEYWLSEHLRMNGLYWGITALFLMGAHDTFKKDEVIEFVMGCFDSKHGAFGAFKGHEAHILSTLSALQILKLYNSLYLLDEKNESGDGETKKEKIVKFIKDLQLPDGSFQGDRFGEIDTRFSYTSVYSLALLGSLNNDVIDIDKAADFVLKCQNFDGGFGLVPGAESHAAQVFTCLAMLSIVDKLDKIKDKDLLIWWLSERQCSNGGLNGRPEKLPDVCYSWWVLSCLSILGRLDYINKEKLREFILLCQDTKEGGVADRPDNQVDVYHTLFGISGLSLLGYTEEYDLLEVDPVYCLPVETTKDIQSVNKKIHN